LSERDFTVFFSEQEAAVGDQLDDTLRRALHRSRILVVVVNKGTLVDPRWVRTEVEEFRRNHPERPIVSVNIGGALQDPALAAAAEPWLRFTDKIWIDESQSAGDEGIVSDGVIDRLATAPNALRSRTRWRWTVRAAFAVLSVVTAAALWFAWSDRQNAQRANVAAEIATVRGLTAQSDLFRTQALATAPGWASLLHQSAMLAIEARRRRADRDNARALRAAADAVGGAPRRLDLPLSAFRGISSRADRLAVASANGAALDIWDLAAGRIVTTIPTVAPQFGAYFSPDGSCLLVLNENRVSAWQTRAAGGASELWTREASFPESQPHRASVAFSADAQTVALIDGKSVVLLNAGTGREIRRFQHDQAVTQVAFSGDATARIFQWKDGHYLHGVDGGRGARSSPPRDQPADNRRTRDAPCHDGGAAHRGMGRDDGRPPRRTECAARLG
jgi:hypothetical protein